MLAHSRSSLLSPGVQIVRHAFDDANGSTLELVNAIQRHKAHIPLFFESEPMYLLTFARCVEAPVIEALFEAGVDFEGIETLRPEPPCLAQAFSNPNKGVFETLIKHGRDPRQPFWKDEPKRRIVCHVLDEDRVEFFAALLNTGKFQHIVKRAIDEEAIGCVEYSIHQDPKLIKNPEVIKLAEKNGQIGSILERVSLTSTTPSILQARKPSARL